MELTLVYYCQLDYRLYSVFIIFCITLIYGSVQFYLIYRLCIYYYNQPQNCPMSPYRNYFTLPHKPRFFFCPLANTNLFSISIVLPFLRMLCKWSFITQPFEHQHCSISIMPLRPIQNIVYISSSLSFVAEQYSIIWQYQSSFNYSSGERWLVFSTFLLLQIKLF